MTEPLAVTPSQPEFSWRVTAARASLHAVTQSAYEIGVAATARDLTDGGALLANSGKVSSKASSAQGASDAGPAFEAQHEHAWQVRLWDEPGVVDRVLHGIRSAAYALRRESRTIVG